jgi:hypothetical protein
MWPDQSTSSTNSSRWINGARVCMFFLSAVSAGQARTSPLAACFFCEMLAACLVQYTTSCLAFSSRLFSVAFSCFGQINHYKEKCIPKDPYLTHLFKNSLSKNSQQLQTTSLGYTDSQACVEHKSLPTKLGAFLLTAKYLDSINHFE